MKNKILFITNKIPHYRLPLYEEVGKMYDLTIAHPGDLVESINFRQLKVNQKNYGPFMYYSGIDQLSQYDILIVYANLRLINLYELLWLKRTHNLKLVLFGIGVSASYDKRYDRDKMVGWILSKIIIYSDAVIFYDAYPVIKYSSMGVPPEKLFVAYNTVQGNHGELSSISERNSILFVGSLYRQKGLKLLLEAYSSLTRKHTNFPVLNIIGDGPEKAEINSWLEQHSLENKVNLLGAITCEVELSHYFKDAICCVSPGQAGLSVQKGMSYGVPFVTSHYPISGGEFTSIIDGVTGFFFDGTVEGLHKKLEEIIYDPNLEEISENCYLFYHRFRSPSLWIRGFTDALEFVNK